MLKKSLNPRVDVNPAILVWARTSSRMTPDQAVKKLKIGSLKSKTAVERLADLESGITRPKRSTLDKMAKVYRRPLLTFYLSEPPIQADRGIDFRTLPDENESDPNDHLDALLRDIRSRQSMVRSLMEEEDEDQQISFVGSHKISDGIDVLVRSLGEVLGIDYRDNYSNYFSQNDFNFLRERAEKAGVFVVLKGDLGSYHTKLFVDRFRGFAIADNVAPFIVINQNDPNSGFSITLLHELTHILLGQTCFSNSRSEHQVEQFCNEVAARFLFPFAELKRLDATDLISYERLVQRFSEYSSRRDMNFIEESTELSLTKRVNFETFKVMYGTYQSKNSSGSVVPVYSRDGDGIYYRVQRYRIGKLLLGFVNRMHRNGSLTTTKAANVLGVNPHVVHKLFNH